MNALLQLEFPAAKPIDARPLIIDSFAGGGGASTGIEMALGRSPDIAINHDAAALAMHEVNHPETLHLNSNVWHVDPAEVCKGRRVGLAWFSPDCKHHSKAKGGKPVKKNIRDLAWVVILWAKRARPDVIALENVEEFRDWGPLTPESKPCPDRKGQTFKHWIKELKRLGYKVEWRELRACDYGAPTIRKRLFLIARCDGRPIAWPEPSHGRPDSAEVVAGLRKPWRTAAEIIDWSLPCPSIFDSSAEIMEKFGLRAKRPLADATLRRVARGVMRYVIEAREPFLITYAQQGGGIRSGFDPLHTVTASPKDQNALIVPTLVQTGYGERPGQAPRVPGLDKPLGTTVAGGTKHALVAAFLAQHNAGERMKNNAGRPATAPLSTLTTRGTQQQVVAAHLMPHYGASVARAATDPVGTITAGGGGKQAIVAAFLQKYHGQGLGQRADEPLHTLSTRDTFGLVTVEIHGTTYAITDIGMRMLTPREQFRAQSFPDSYRIEEAGGRTLTKTEQTRMCGNSVPPVMASALIRANCQHLAEEIAS
jgi:DNA (cytosine-5)-methyltransferase 1